VSRYPALTGKQLLQALQRMGFELIRVRGSHHFLRHTDGRKTVVPVHSGEVIGPGLLTSILRHVQITRDELVEQL
jgi:predicted RNA binding protein YcfA (HicA-like mRNA interferase family)